MKKSVHRNPKPDDQAQSQAFLAKAREIGADKEQSAADELMGRLAKMPPEPKKASAKNPKSE